MPFILPDNVKNQGSSRFPVNWLFTPAKGNPMYRGWNVVTEQGRTAVDKYEAAVEALKAPLFEYISAQEDGISSKELQEWFVAGDSEHRTAAYWKLMDDNSILLTSDRRIKKAHEGNNNWWY